jgi:ABC-type Mn2+/Zn2+ transport system ATPase subunit
MNPPAIELRAVRVTIGAHAVLRIPELTVTAGELFAVMGPNGAGKSTLLRVLLGLQPLASGSARVLGEEVASLAGGARLRLRRGIGYVPQLLPTRGELPVTVREVVAIGRTGRVGLWRRLGRDDWRAVDEWLERLGIAALANRGFGEISGGGATQDDDRPRDGARTEVVAAR